MTMRALITGVNGFVGSHLAALLRARGAEVFGITREPREAEPADGVQRLVGDVADAAFVAGAMREIRPSHVFHLAWSFDNAARANTQGQDADIAAASAVFEAVRQSVPESWVLLASSSAVYGSPAAQPISEDTPLKPITEYGSRKVAAEEVAAAYARDHGLHVVVTRTFNLIGPGVPSRLLPGSLAAQVVAAESSGSRTVRIGRLDSSRDFLDVRDAVRAYLGLAESPDSRSGIFNVCAGVSRSCLELAEAFIAAAVVPVELVHDTSRLQIADVDRQRGTTDRLTRATGWVPEISFEASVRAMLEWERDAVRTGNRR